MMDNKAGIMPRDYVDRDIKIINVGAVSGGEGFLIVTKHKTALLESGFSFSAGKMMDNLEDELGGRTLDYVLLTHSHYDHASGSYYLKKRFKDVKIVASNYAAKILSKPSAIEVMREMNSSAAEFYGWEETEDKLEPFTVDIPVAEGDIIDLGDLTLIVMDAPGHTKCCVSYYSPEKKLLLSCETAGCLASPGLVAPAYLVGYEMSVNYIRRILGMDIERLHVPHQGVIEGRDVCRLFLQDALNSAVMLKDLIINDHRQGKSREEITEHYKKVFFTEDLKKLQPPKAFDLNASYLIPMIIKECMV